MSRISLSTCPICNAQDTLAYEKMEFKGRSHEWYECSECGSALLWLGDDQWAYQKVGREDKAYLLKRPISEEELLALLPEPGETAPELQAADEAPEPEEEALPSLFSSDWPEYDEDPFAFLFHSTPEEGGVEPAALAEEEPAPGESGPLPSSFEEEIEPAEPALAEAEDDWGELELEPYASLFREWEEEAEAAGPGPVPEEAAPSLEGGESPALFSRAWFEEIETAESTPATAGYAAELEEVVPEPGIGDDWPQQAEDAPTLVADDDQIRLEEGALRPLARGEWPDEVEGAAAVTVSRDIPAPRRERSAVGRIIPWLLALCLIAFLFLIAIGVYQVVTGTPLF